MEKISIIATINKVMSDISKSGFEKDKVNEIQKYKYRSIDGLYNTISPILATHGLVIIPQIIKCKVVDVGTTKSGATTWRVRVKMKYIFKHIHNEDFIESIFWGEALDTSDKATNKATTSCYKYMMIQIFAMPINGDDESDNIEAIKQIVIKKLEDVKSKFSNDEKILNSYITNMKKINNNEKVDYKGLNSRLDVLLGGDK